MCVCVCLCVHHGDDTGQREIDRGERDKGLKIDGIIKKEDTHGDRTRMDAMDAMQKKRRVMNRV